MRSQLTAMLAKGTKVYVRGRLYLHMPIVSMFIDTLAMELKKLHEKNLFFFLWWNFARGTVWQK